MKLRQRPIALALLCALLPGYGALAATPAESTAPAAVMSYTFHDRPIAELFGMISRTARINIVLGRGVTGNVSINLYDLTVREAIHAIAEAGGYVVVERAGGFLITDAKGGV